MRQTVAAACGFLSQPVSRLARTGTVATRTCRHNADMTLRSHDDHPTWRRYQPFFPPGMQCLAAPKRMVILDGASHMPTEHPGVDQLEAAVLQFMQSVTTTSVAN